MLRFITNALSTLLLLAPLISAATAPGPLELQRADFLKAESALKRGDHDRYRSLRANLADYPLAPYLDFQQLAQRLKKVTVQEAESFLQQNHETPIAWRFRRLLLDSLGAEQRWDDFLHFYRTDKNASRRCLYASALLKTGKAEAAMAEAPALWLNGHSMPRECDTVFAAWRDEGRLTPSLVWRRIGLAMEKRNRRLAGYLGRYLPKTERHWLDLWLKIDANPRLIVDSGATSGIHPQKDDILQHGLQLLARTDPATATSAWKKLAPGEAFTAAQQYQVERALALGWIYTDDPQALIHLQTFNISSDDQALHELRVREALSRNAWKVALEWIEALPQSLSNNENWRYWRAKILANLGRSKEAEQLFNQLAKERSYHGFLAADQIGEPYNLEHQALQIPDERVDALASRGGFKRALELFRLGRLIEARREWRSATRKLDVEQLKSAAKLAQNWGWHSQAIFTLAKSGYWDDLELRFPIAHETAVADAAKRKSLDDSWVLAVIRQESAFSADARSHAGAMGLMQLMPATARATAKQMKRRPPKRGELLQPDTNIEIGTSYLKSVYDRLDDNTVLAISAYNAGPHRVLRWLPEKQELDADLWVETIPFRETRRYTQRVLAYSVIYDQRLGKKITQLKERMRSIAPKKIKIQNASL
ncbi:MAG: transglycosylase SLT domain-containing protein [Gammaproteobacteria bacterium]|nr:transglycosylase SLT domain-containing protein [Gammaproteobacteria bacterium]